MSRPRSTRRRKVLLALRIPAYLLCLYLATYLLMMDVRWPPFNMAKRDWCDQSTYRFAPYENLVGIVGMTWIFPTTCWANDVFWPIDWALQPVTKPYRDAYFRESLPGSSGE
jgi:hypothetical protein